MKPLPKAIYVHPDDFAKLQALATSADPHRDAPSWATGFPSTAVAIPVHVTPYVPKGRPFFDPPESEPDTLVCTEHDDCRQNVDLGRACWLERRTSPLADGTKEGA